MDAPSLQGVEVGGHGGDQGLTFTGTHLRDTALVQDNAADQLDPEGLHIQRAARAFADCRISLDQQVIQGLPVLKTLFELFCLRPELLISEGLHGRAERFDLVHQGADPLDLSLAVSTEQLVC